LRHVDERFSALLRRDDDFFDRLALGRAYVGRAEQQNESTLQDFAQIANLDSPLGFG